MSGLLLGEGVPEEGAPAEPEAEPEQPETTVADEVEELDAATSEAGVTDEQAVDAAREPDERPVITVEAGDEWPFTVELLPLDAMIVDRTYQRPVEERFVGGIVDDFDETLIGAIDVSDRKGTEVYAILDGQQRWEALKRVGKRTCYAATFPDMDLQDEAGFFFRKNKDRRTMQGYYGFRARVVAGDLGAIGVKDTVEAEGFRLGPKTDHEDVLASVAACETAWTWSSEHRDESLTPALRTIRENWRGQKGSLQASTILAFATFWRRYPDELVDEQTLKDSLGFLSTPLNLINLGREKRAQSPSLAMAMAEHVAETYNRRRRGPVLPPLRPQA